jgi:hypothetical protein
VGVNAWTLAKKLQFPRFDNSDIISKFEGGSSMNKKSFKKLVTTFAPSSGEGKPRDETVWRRALFIAGQDEAKAKALYEKLVAPGAVSPR